MFSSSLAKAGLLAAFLAFIFFSAWEIYLRQKGLQPSYDDGGALWSDKRARVYKQPEKAVVFIGSSRIKYDLDVSTWRKETGMDAVQLAMEGSSPLLVLEDLANDPKFNGNLVIDVTEFLFFSTTPRNHESPTKNLKYYKDRTPAQRASFAVNRVAEAGAVFLDEDNFSLNAVLNKLPIPNRAGIFNLPIFPTDFGRVTFDRQNKMTPHFIEDTMQQKAVQDIWVMYGRASTEPPASGAKLDSLINSTKLSIEKIKNRGGKVYFVRTPSSGPMLQREMGGFPKDKVWDKLLAVTGCPGIHFQEHQELANFICPEWSHLTPDDAVLFTKSFIAISRQKGWFTNAAVASSH